MLSPFAFMFGMLGFAVAMLCLKDVQEIKKILSNYVSDKDRRLLLAKKKPEKLHYIFLGLYIITMFVVITYFVFT